jgi:Fur family ferric uptake transcriptional regulator
LHFGENVRAASWASSCREVERSTPKHGAAETIAACCSIEISKDWATDDGRSPIPFVHLRVHPWFKLICCRCCAQFDSRAATRQGARDMDPGHHHRIYEFLESKGLRKTSQRDAIIEAAFSTTEHYTADDLLLMAKKVDSSVSRATVYRTLPLLVESGMLREMDFGRDHKFYDPNYVDHPNHSHLICLDCAKILEFEDVHMDTLEICISKRMGFTPTGKVVRIEAHCDELRTAGVCKKRAAVVVA